MRSLFAVLIVPITLASLSCAQDSSKTGAVDQKDYVEAHKEAASKGDVQVKVILARVAEVPVRDILGSQRYSRDKHLQLLVMVVNNSDSRKVSYSG